MKKHEIIIVMLTLSMSFVIPIIGLSQLGDPNSLISTTKHYWAPIYALGSILTLIFVISDLYKRELKNPNTKITWALIMFVTGGIGFILYIFIHAIKPRPQHEIT